MWHGLPLSERNTLGSLKGLSVPFGGRFFACGVNLASSYLAQGLHSASIPGILALDLCPSDTNKILTGKGTSSACWGLRGVS